MSEQRCPACGGELVDGIIISGTMWTDSRTRFVPARFLNDRSLFGRYRKEIPTGARACRRCGVVTLLVNPGTLGELMREEEKDE
jgi:hypothetical protein